MHHSGKSESYKVNPTLGKGCLDPASRTSALSHLATGARWWEGPPPLCLSAKNTNSMARKLLFRLPKWTRTPLLVFYSMQRPWSYKQWCLWINLVPGNSFLLQRDYSCEKTTQKVKYLQDLVQNSLGKWLYTLSLLWQSLNLNIYLWQAYHKTMFIVPIVQQDTMKKYLQETMFFLLCESLWDWAVSLPEFLVRCGGGLWFRWRTDWRGVKVCIFLQVNGLRGKEMRGDRTDVMPMEEENG